MYFVNYHTSNDSEFHKETVATEQEARTRFDAIVKDAESQHVDWVELIDACDRELACWSDDSIDECDKTPAERELHDSTKQGWVDWASDELNTQPPDVNWAADVSELLLEVYMHQFKDCSAEELRDELKNVLWGGFKALKNQPFAIAAKLVDRFADEDTGFVEDCLDCIGFEVH